MADRCVLLSCHYDIIEWLEPDWVFDTATGQFQRGRGLWRRPRIDVQLWETDWRYWSRFEPHHYLKLPRMIAATNYVATVDGELVAHLAVSTTAGLREARACRLVVMPEWQGAGVGMRFLNAVCQRWLDGKNRYSKPVTSLFHTSHPGLAAALRRDPKWRQVSANLYGDNKRRSARSVRASRVRAGRKHDGATGYGGHFRAVQGFRYVGGALMLRILISGQRSFGADVLALCLRLGHQVVAAAAPADGGGPGGWDRLRAAADLHGIPWIPPGALRAEAVPDGTDLILAAHSHEFIGRRTRLRARFGALGYHPSLLPLHRGRDSIRWAIHMGDRVTGGTVFWLSDNVDAGDVAAQEWCFIRRDDDAAAIWRRELRPMGVRLFERALRDLADGRIVAVPQDHSLATWEPAWDRPPLHRPELLMIGGTLPEGARVERRADALRRGLLAAGG